MTQFSGSLAKHILEEVISQGVTEFCLCPGSRNAPLIYPLIHSSQVHLTYWPEERSAAFFALGRIKATGRPVAVVTTSGTAAGELLPATMEAYYTGLPLVLITADRPRRFRGSGAPQSAEQVGLFGCYAREMYDLEGEEVCSLEHWTQKEPLHLNVCFEEPKDCECQEIRLNSCLIKNAKPVQLHFSPPDDFLSFLKKSRFPLVVVGAMPISVREEAIRFLLHLNAPIYAEGISGIREDPRLELLRIKRVEDLWRSAAEKDYPIDAILRLGAIPTARFWRDLEEKKLEIAVCSITEHPFSGLSWGNVVHTSLSSFFLWGETLKMPYSYPFEKWRASDERAWQYLENLFQEEP